MPVVSFETAVASPASAWRAASRRRSGRSCPAGARVGVRPVDFDNLDHVSAQVAHKPRGAGAGGLHADNRELPELLEPRQQRPLAGHVGREALGAQPPATLVERGNVMVVGVRVNAADDTPV